MPGPSSAVKRRFAELVLKREIRKLMARVRKLEHARREEHETVEDDDFDDFDTLSSDPEDD